MPGDNDNAAQAPGVNEGATQDAGKGAEPTAKGFDIDPAELLRTAGVAEEVVTQVAGQKSEEKETEDVSQTDTTAETETETPAATEETDEETEPTETETEETAEETETEPKGEEEHPKWFQKRLGKWTRQKDRLEGQIEDLRGELDDLKTGQTSGEDKARKAPTPTPEDPLAHITDPAALENVVESQRQLRSWCRRNRDGFVFDAGTDKERVVSKDEVAAWEDGADLIIEKYAPQKAEQLKGKVNEQELKATFDQMAHTEYPALFDKESEDYAASQKVLELVPEIANHPARDFVLGVYLEGVRSRNARLQKNGAANNGAAEKSNLPEALRRKLPPIPKTSAPNTPRGSRLPVPAKEIAAARERLVNEGGTREAALDVLRAMDNERDLAGAKGRAPVPV